MAHCPECSANIDLDEDEVEEGEIMSCPECEAELEVVSKSPLQLNALADEDEEEAQLALQGKHYQTGEKRAQQRVPAKRK